MGMCVVELEITAGMKEIWGEEKVCLLKGSRPLHTASNAPSSRGYSSTLQASCLNANALRQVPTCAQKHICLYCVLQALLTVASCHSSCVRIYFAFLPKMSPCPTPNCAVSRKCLQRIGRTPHYHLFFLILSFKHCHLGPEAAPPLS